MSKNRPAEDRDDSDGGGDTGLPLWSRREVRRLAIRELGLVLLCAALAGLLGAAVAVVAVYYGLQYFGFAGGGGLHGGGHVAAMLIFVAFGAAALLGAGLGGSLGFSLGLKWRLGRARRRMLGQLRDAATRYVADAAGDILESRFEPRDSKSDRSQDA